MPEAAGRSELVLEAARELDGLTVTCRAANLAGESWADTELSVNCKFGFCFVFCHQDKDTPLVAFCAFQWVFSCYSELHI